MVLANIITLLFALALCRGHKEPLQAKDIISNYNIIKDNVIVKFTYLENPETFSLAEIPHENILAHINHYLETYVADWSKNVTLVVTHIQGFIKINGKYMYNFVPLYDEFDTIIACTNQNPRNSTGIFNSTEYKMCRHRTLVCDSLYEDYEAAYNQAEIIPNFDEIKNNYNVFYTHMRKNYTLADIHQLRALVHLATYIKKNPTERDLEINTHYNFYRINGEILYKVIPHAAIYEHMSLCYSSKIRNEKKNRTYGERKAYHAECAATLLICTPSK